MTLPLRIPHHPCEWELNATTAELFTRVSTVLQCRICRQMVELRFSLRQLAEMLVAIREYGIVAWGQDSLTDAVREEDRRWKLLKHQFERITD